MSLSAENRAGKNLSISKRADKKTTKQAKKQQKTTNKYHVDSVVKKTGLAAPWSKEAKPLSWPVA